MTLASALWVAIGEELLFRWYLLVIPTRFGLYPLGVAVTVSAVAFGLIHEYFGLSTMVSRTAFGFFLASAAAFSPVNIYAAIGAHVAYNALVCLKPATYALIRSGA